MTSGIDGLAEIARSLDRLGDGSTIAVAAPRSAALYRYLADGIANPETASDFSSLTETLLAELAIWWPVDAYAVMPAMTPWCVRDRSCRYDQGPEAWGAPRDDGYLRDDNSIIKKLPLPLTVRGRPGHPYDGRRPHKGFTACHLWRELPGDAIAGEDPWLYSFMPNLVWVPSWLAPLTDREGSHVADLLRRTSLARFRDVEVAAPVQAYAERAWARLHSPVRGHILPRRPFAEFRPDEAFFRRRASYLAKTVAACDAIANGRAPRGKLICSRYTDGLPRLERAVVKSFGESMRAYLEAIRLAIPALAG